MARKLILETSFLIDLEREIRRSTEGPATALLVRESDSLLHITFTVAGELAPGISLENRQRWEDFIAPFRVLDCTRDVCWEYGRAYRYLQRVGSLIGTNDLWIAATALAHRMPVVTRNEKDFERVPDLEVVSYT